MSKKAHVLDNLPAPAGPYSQVVEAGDFVFTAGFGPQDPKTGEVPEGVEAQTSQVLNNLETALAAVGLTFNDVVKTTVHLERLDRDAPGFNKIYRERFTEPFPVRTTVGSSLANILVEIDAVAMRPST